MPPTPPKETEPWNPRFSYKKGLELSGLPTYMYSQYVSAADRVISNIIKLQASDYLTKVWFSEFSGVVECVVDEADPIYCDIKEVNRLCDTKTTTSVVITDDTGYSKDVYINGRVEHSTEFFNMTFMHVKWSFPHGGCSVMYNGANQWYYGACIVGGMTTHHLIDHIEREYPTFLSTYGMLT